MRKLTTVILLCTLMLSSCGKKADSVAEKTASASPTVNSEKSAASTPKQTESTDKYSGLLDTGSESKEIPGKYYDPYKYDGIIRSAETKPLGRDIRSLYRDMDGRQSYTPEVKDHSSDVYFAYNDGYTVSSARDSCMAFLTDNDLQEKMKCVDFTWNELSGVMATYRD